MLPPSVYRAVDVDALDALGGLVDEVELDESMEEAQHIQRLMDRLSPAGDEDEAVADHAGGPGQVS